MSKKRFIDTVMVPACPPKDSSIRLGYSFEQDGKLYYADGKYRVCLREHFSDTPRTVTDLVESTIRYKANKAS